MAHSLPYQRAAGSVSSKSLGRGGVRVTAAVIQRQDKHEVTPSQGVTDGLITAGMSGLAA